MISNILYIHCGYLYSASSSGTTEYSEALPTPALLINAGLVAEEEILGSKQRVKTISDQTVSHKEGPVLPEVRANGAWRRPRRPSGC